MSEYDFVHFFRDLKVVFGELKQHHLMLVPLQHFRARNELRNAVAAITIMKA